MRFLTQAETVLDADAVLSAIAEFIDATVRRLEDAGVSDTLLQEEWAAVQQADDEERDFCLVASAWGQDPYDTPPDIASLVLGASTEIGDVALLAELSRAVPSAKIAESAVWLREASMSDGIETINAPSLGAFEWSSTVGVAPWRIGYERTRRFRLLIGLDSADSAPVEDFVSIHQTHSHAPINIDGLMSSESSSSLAIAVGAHTGVTSRRFAAARAIGRRSLVEVQRRSLLTRSSQYTERTERAFAAELLAPASGLAEMLDGDFTDEAVQRAATYFGVDPLVVAHQVENQIAA